VAAEFQPSSVAEPLETGRWLVLIVQADCEHCQDLIAEHFADSRLHRPNERTAMFLAGATTWPFQLDQISLRVDAARIDQVARPRTIRRNPGGVSSQRMESSRTLRTEPNRAALLKRSFEPAMSRSLA